METPEVGTTPACGAERDHIMMTKKHFEVVAAILRNTYTDESEGERVIRDIANDLADYFASENPNFKREHFLAAANAKGA